MPNKKEIEVCTKAAFTIIGLSLMAPIFLVAAVIWCGFSLIKNHYFPSKSYMSLEDQTKNNNDDNDEWFDVDTLGDGFNSDA